MNIKKDIGRRIRMIRAAQKLTQEQFAKQILASPATVSGWEIGDIGISIDAAIRVATYANVSLDWLLTGKDTIHAQLPTDNQTPEETRLMEYFRKLSKTSQSAVLRITEMMQK